MSVSWLMKFGPERLKFDIQEANDIVRSLNSVAKNVDSARADFVAQAGSAMVDFHGVFADIFRDHVGWADVDGQNLVTCLRSISTQLTALITSAETENARRDGVRAAREEKFAELELQYQSQLAQGLGPSAPQAPSVAHVEALIPFTPGTPPTSRTNDVSLRPRETPSGGSAKGGGKTSARPDNLRKFSAAANSWSGNLRGSLARVNPAGSDWGYVRDGGAIAAISKWYASNAKEREWIGRLATEFSKAGGRGGLRTLADGAIADALTAAGLYPGREDGLELELPQTFGTMPGTGYAADPVNTATGNFIEPESDFVGAGGAASLSLSRMYNSQDEGTGAFGPGWSSTLDTRLELTDERAAFVQADGRSVLFPREGDGWGRALRGNYWLTEEDPHLTVLSNASREGEQLGGRLRPWVVRDNAGHWWAFSQAGEWLGCGSGPGTIVRVLRDGDGRVTELMHERGRRISVEYVGSRAARVVGPGGTSMTYRYDDAGRLTDVETPLGVRSYRWNDDGLVDQVTGESGAVECVNTYDADKRVLTQRTEFGRDIHFAYLTGRVTVVSNADGEQANSWRADRWGRLVGVTDTAGNRQSMSYDPHGNLVSVRERDGETTVHVVDQRGRRIRTVTPEGADTSYEWDDTDRLTQISTAAFETGEASSNEANRGPAVTRFEYATAADRGPNVITDPMGGVTRLTWEHGLLMQVVDPCGVSVKLRYDAYGDLAVTVDALGNETVITRDDAGRVLSRTSPGGHRTRWQYDDAGNVIRREEAGGAIWLFEYGPGAVLTAQIDPLGARTEYEYGAHGALTKLRDTLGRVTEQRVDEFGNPAALVLPDGAEWLLQHDGLSRLREVIDPDGGAWKRDYDANGALAKVTDATGNAVHTARDRQARTETVASAFTSTTTEFDEFGRPVRTTRQDGGSAIAVYDLCGRVIEEIDAEGGLTRYERDPSGRVVRARSAAGRETSFEYDECGRPAAMTDGEGGRTELRYDADSRVVERILPNGDVARATYDAAGRIVAQHLPGRGVARYRYDLAGRVVAAQDTRFGKRTFEYDSAGQLIAATNGVGGKTRYDYDEQGRIVAITDPLGGVTRRTYTALSRVDSVTDALGRTTVGTYDAAGRQLSQVDPDGRRLAWEYDAEGLVCGVVAGEKVLSEATTDHRTGALSVTDFTGPSGSPVAHWVERDRLGRVVARSRGEDITRWEYDADGNRTRMLTASGDEVGYSYDEAGRLARVAHSAFGAITYAYDSAGNLVSAVAGGRAQTWQYRDGFPVEYTLSDADGVTTTRITRDADGRITEVADGDGATAYEYDAAEQLARAVSDIDRAWEYDAAGRVVREHADSHVTEYVYDVAGQLAERSTSDGIRTRYEYDGAGRRTREEGPESSSVFAWDERGWLTSIKSAGAVHRIWVDAFGELAEVEGDRVTWDSAATLPAVTGLGAQSVFAAPGGFTGFGEELASLGWRQARATRPADPWATVSLPTDGGALGLAAHGVPTIAGLEWMGARAYDPGSRGFLSVDPLQPVVGAGWAGNPYSYAGNDPLRELDPLGLSPVTDAELNGLTPGEVGALIDLFSNGSGTAEAVLAALKLQGGAAIKAVDAFIADLPPGLRSLHKVGKAVPYLGTVVTLGKLNQARADGNTWDVVNYTGSAAFDVVGLFVPVTAPFTAIGGFAWDVVWGIGGNITTMVQNPGTFEKYQRDPWFQGLQAISPVLVWAFWDVQP